MKLILRDIPSSLLMIFGFCLSFFIMMNAMSMIRALAMEMDEKNTSPYKERIEFSVSYSVYETGIDMDLINVDEVSRLLDRMQSTMGNVILSNVTLSAGENSDKWQSRIIMSMNETLSIQLSKGDVPDGKKDVLNEPTVLIGESFMDFTKQRNGDSYFNVLGDYFKVEGVLENRSADGFDSTIYVFYDSMSEKSKNRLAKELLDNIVMQIPFQVEIVSNKSNIRNACQELVDVIENETNALIEEQRGEREEYAFADYVSDTKAFLLGILYFYSLLNCGVISSFWFTKKRQEIAIRKMCGYETIKIVTTLANELLLLLGFSSVSVGILLLMHCIIAGDFSIIYYCPKENLLLFIFAILSMLIVTVGISLKQLLGIAPAQGVRKV